MIYNDYNLEEFQSRLKEATKKHNLLPVILGSVRNDDIVFYRPKNFFDGPKILMAGGFHGDEPGGPWSILNFLEEKFYPKDVNLSFLPLVNISGFRLSRRSNFFGHQPNRGYVDVGDGQPASEEDKILKDNINILKVFAVNSMITIHEDDEEKFFIYTLGKNKKLVEAIKKIGGNYFGIKEDGVLKGDNVRTKDGIVEDDYDSSFEHFIKKNGCDVCITVELPKKRNFEERVNCGVKIIKEAIKPEWY
jgi:predicted deacylase